ncbi:MAG: bifunctional phosphoribosylaminoimidazolecarboxamide formyltransferase/IMP cyclohydrolase [bacterium JZ-2024 1]
MSRLALLSVYDKRGLEDFARALSQLGWRFMASGGTWRFLRDHGLEAINIEEWTRFPDLLGGRVKTLHPHIFSALLARTTTDHQTVLEQLGLERIGLVAVNLYPFLEHWRNGRALEELTEFIDIGGPALLRAAAKNFEAVLVVCDPDDYPRVIQAIKEGTDTLEFRRDLAAKVFRLTSAYDSAMASAFSLAADNQIPNPVVLAGWRALDLRYGENPHQYAGYFTASGTPGFQVLQGKPLSYNNLLDATSALEFMSLFPERPFCVIIKHTNPAGAALADTSVSAFLRAYKVDSLAAFGGIIGFSQLADESAAREIVKSFFEVVIAPDYTESALAVFAQRKNLRVLRVTDLRPPPLSFRTVVGGFLVQTSDGPSFDIPSDWELVSGEPADDAVLKDLYFAWRLVGPTKSNAIIVARDGVLAGIGCGQTSRVRSVRYALEQAGERACGAVLASDAFFPFPDSIELAGDAGIRAIVAPGGSIRDAEVASAARARGLTLYFAGRRHFRH